MHVCMLTDYFLPHLLGGTERTVYEISRRLIKRGHKVTVITLDVHEHQRRSHNEGMDIHRLPAISMTRLVRAQLTVSLSAAFETNRIIKSLRPDILHAHNLYFNLTAITPILKCRSRLPLVTTLHLPKMQYGSASLDTLIQIYLKSIGRAVIEYSDRLVAVSESVLNHAIKDLGVQASKITFIPNGVDLGLYSPSDQPPKYPVITYIGRLIQNKGPQFLVQAVPIILKAHPEAHINIVGEGPLRNKLMQDVVSQGLEGRVQFLGTVVDVLPILRATTIFVRPSLTEGMSLAVLEAMACGLPIVASNIEGNAELVEDGKTGYLVSPGNPGALAERINCMLADQRASIILGQNARAYAERLYDWERITDKTLTLYDSLL
jgi:glycosyltransferase involved in cell wall biosynthesis